MLTRSTTSNAKRSAENENLGQPSPKKHKEDYYEMEYIVKTERYPSAMPFPSNICMALAKFKGYEELYYINDYEGCMEMLRRCVDREDAEERLAVALKEQLKKKQDEDEKLYSDVSPTLYQSSYDFDFVYPGYKARDQYKGKQNKWKLEARAKEENWNEKLEEKGIAPVYIFNWINNRAINEFEFLTENSVSPEMEKLRLQLRRELDQKKMREGDVKPHCECFGKCDGNCPCMHYTEPGRKQLLLENGQLEESALTHNFNNNMMVCGDGCTCSEDCPYKAKMQRTFPLIVFYTGDVKGYGVFSSDDIPAGTFVGKYLGRVTMEPRRIDRDLTYDFELVKQPELEKCLRQKKKRGMKKKYDIVPYIDGLSSGSECRFFNNGCDQFSNLAPVHIFTCDNRAYHEIAFFTKRTIERGQELTFEYTTEKPKDGKQCQCHPDCTNGM